MFLVHYKRVKFFTK